MKSYFNKIFSTILIILLFSLSGKILAKFDEMRIYSGKDVYAIPAFTKGNNVFFSIEDFAKALSVNTYYNSKTKKIELKFISYKLKVTAGNPFFIFTTKSTNKTEILQLPSSSFIVGDKIFVSTKYIIPLLKRALSKNLSLIAKYKLVVGGNIKTSNNEFVNTKPVTKRYKFGITGLSVSERSNGTLVRIKTKQKIGTYNSKYENNKLIIIFRDVNAETDNIDYNNESSLINDLSVENKGEDTEFIFEVGEEYSSSDVINSEKGNDLLILLHNKIFDNNSLKDNKSKWDFDVVVIDAGHGGIDPGTLGVLGLKEKNINLAVALKLGKLLEKNMKSVKVVYTRKTDKAVDLYKRGKIANEKGGKLFISIHCNSTPHKPSSANGFEIYLLRPGKTEQAIKIAERENSVIKYENNAKRYKKLTAENFILVSMAQSSYMKYSEQFSDILNREMKRNLREKSRGIKQAGFFVLVGASMPSVLIETGYLSNKKEARYLNSNFGQQRIAQSIFNSIKLFKKKYEKSLNYE